MLSKCWNINYKDKMSHMNSLQHITIDYIRVYNLWYNQILSNNDVISCSVHKCSHKQFYHTSHLYTQCDVSVGTESSPLWRNTTKTKCSCMNTTTTPCILYYWLSYYPYTILVSINYLGRSFDCFKLVWKASSSFHSFSVFSSSWGKFILSGTWLDIFTPSLQ